MKKKFFFHDGNNLVVFEFFMVDEVFNLTDKIEFIPDEDLEGELNIN